MVGIGPPFEHVAEVFTVAGPHVPQTQPSVAPQGVLHAPQLALSVLVSTHWPAHAVSPGRHVAAHLPAEQTSLAEHVTPHPPQLPGSPTVGMHCPLQRDW
jgi:hypothetical protein